MDKWQALQSFFSSFELTAYDESSVPENAQLPYITYTAAVDSFDVPVVISCNLWYQSTSWAAISQKAEQISNYLGSGGVMLPITGGGLWITRGSPFAQRVNEESDAIKHIYIVLMCEFITD